MNHSSDGSSAAWQTEVSGPGGKSFADRFDALVRAELREGGASLKQLSVKLRMSQRTLQRRLASEGLSHRDVVDRLRRATALHFAIHSNEPWTEVSARLGYGYPSTFHKAFKRWTGQTASQVRTAARMGQSENPMPSLDALSE